MLLTVGACTDAGRKGPPNEDAVWVYGPEDGLTLAILADGMGARKAGERASQAAINTIRDVFLASGHPTRLEAGARLENAVVAANSHVRQMALSRPELAGMGCTVLVAAVIDKWYWTAHLGDSRAYLVTTDEIEQLTEDHTWVGTQVKEGLISTEQAARHPRRNLLDRALGVEDIITVTVQSALQARPGHRLVLCTDGVHGVLKPKAIRQIVLESDVQFAAETLVRRAIEAKSHDNVSAIVAQWLDT